VALCELRGNLIANLSSAYHPVGRSPTAQF
jgi:hypothetical protein